MADITTNISVVLYRSKTLSNGEHPLMVRITKQRKVKYLSMGMSCNPKFWDFEKSQPRKSHPNKDLLDKVIAKKLSAYNDMAFELKAFEKDFTPESLIKSVERPTKNISVFAFFETVIKGFKNTKQIGNIKVYSHALRSLKKFTHYRDLKFQDMDYLFLTKHEAEMRKADFMDTTISIHFRTLRSLYNMAIKENIARVQDYPFKEFKISKFDTTTRKRALTKEDFKKIEALKLTKGTNEFEARQYFVFSYYGYGINFIDIANLKWKNIIGDRITYNRSKTGKDINFRLQEPAKKILDYWKPTSGGNPDNYIFPILNTDTHITPTQKDNRIHKVITRINKGLKEVGELAGIETPLTTYVARHTFATVLKKQGVGTSLISEMMGHDSESTTQTYLSSFENEILDKAAGFLL